MFERQRVILKRGMPIRQTGMTGVAGFGAQDEIRQCQHPDNRLPFSDFFLVKFLALVGIEKQQSQEQHSKEKPEEKNV